MYNFWYTDYAWESHFSLSKLMSYKMMIFGEKKKLFWKNLKSREFFGMFESGVKFKIILK